MISSEAQRRKRRCSADQRQRPWGLVVAAVLMAMMLFATASASGGESEKSEKKHVNLFDMDGMRHVTSRLSPAIVKLNPSGDCVDCRALEEFWELMGQQSSNHGLSVMWEVDCEVAPLVCSQFPIRTGHPTMVGWTGRAFTAPYNGPKDLEGLYKWIQSVVKLAEQPQQRFRDVVANSANNIVDIPDDESFFIRFDGGGCQSCRQLDPYWNHLSDEHPNAGVGVVIDCAAQPQFCAATDVAGMVKPGQPSFAYYTAEDGGKLDWFNGPRSLYGLSHWVESLVGIPDDGMQVHRNFDGIYARNSWVQDTGVDSNGSGTGSALEGNESYMDFITSLIRSSSKNKRNIQSIVDVGCGDFNLMRHVVVGPDGGGGGKTYHGYDVSKIAVERARAAAAAKQQQAATATTNITFTVSEPFQEYEPADLLIVKDVLQHLPLEDAMSVVNQLHKFRYAVIVNDLDPSLPNVDVDYGSGLPMVAGGYRSLDVQQAPFHLNCAERLDLHPHLHSLIPNAKKITCLVERNDDDRNHDDEL